MRSRKAVKKSESLDQVRWRLAKLWYIGAGLIFLLLIVQSFGTVYGGRVGEVWSWALPALIPTLSLITSVLGSAALVRHGGKKPKVGVKRRFAAVSFWLSVVYLSLILATILSQPIVVILRPDWSFGAVDALKQSHLWLAPIQGVVVSALAVLFFSEKTAASDA